MWYRIYALIIKELLQLLRDPKGKTVLIMPPLIQLLIFANAATLEVKDIELAVLNQDCGPRSAELIQRFIGSPYFKEITYIRQEDKAYRAIESRDVMAIVKIEANFSKNIDNNQTATAQIILDGRNSNSAQIINGYIQRIIDDFSASIVYKQQTYDAAPSISIRHWFNPNLDYMWFTLPGLLATILTILGITVAGLSIAYEIEMGTFEQLLVSPLGPLEIVIGKAVPTLIIGMAEALILFLASIVIFRIPFVGSFAYLLLTMAIYLVSILGIGLFISSLCATQQQAILGSFVFMAPAIMLSGFATPVENMPEWLQTVSFINPIRHFLSISRGLYLKDMSFHDVAMKTIPLICIGAITLAVSALIFKKKIS